MPLRNVHEGITLNGLLPWVNVKEEDFFDIQQSRFLYARGFLVCKEADFEINAHFSEISIGGEYYLYYHKLIQMTVQEDREKNASVILLGTAYFTNSRYIHETGSEAETLLEKLAESQESFEEALDYLAGRYALVCQKQDRMFVVNDPCGLRTIYYCPDSQCFGSHLELVNAVAKKGTSAMERHFVENDYTYMYAYPGTLTKYDNIFMLIPDFSLSLDRYEIKRFFPREKMEKTKDVWEIRNQYMEMIQISVEQIRKKGKKICVSLTGGRDSKVSYYTTEKYKDEFVYFTEARDDDIAEAKKVALDHHLRWIGTDSKDLLLEQNNYHKAYDRILELNVFPSSVRLSLKTQFWNMNLFGTEDEFIHIHSNCAEAGRGREPEIEMPFRAEEYSFEKFYDVYLKSTFRWLNREKRERQNDRMRRDTFLKEEVKKFYDILNLDAVVPLGYNPWDFAYIEYRTAFFLSQQHMLNDAVFESISLTNSREVLMLMWRLPEEYISPGIVLYQCLLNEKDPDFREKNMGKRFVPKWSEEEIRCYQYLYGGYILEQFLTCEEEKVELCKKVLKMNSTVKWAYRDLVRGYIRQKKFSEAVEIYERMTAYDASLCGMGEELCNALRNSAAYGLARQVVRRALDCDRNSPWAYKQLSHIVCKEEKNLYGGLVFAETAFRMNRKDRWIAENYIRLLLQNGNLEKAHRILSDAISEDKKAFWPYLGWALYMEKKGEYGKALEYAVSAKRIMPDDKTINYLLSKLKLNCGQCT